MRRAARAGIVVAGVVAVGLAGAITLNATQTSSNSVAGATPSAAVSAPASAPGASKTSAATPGATASAPAASTSASAAPSGQAPAAPPATSAKPDAPVPPAPAAPAPAPAAPAPVAPAPAAPAPVAQGLDAAGIQRIKDTCTARLQSDAAHSSIVTGTVVPRPFTVVSIAYSGNPVQSTAASGLASYDILMKITTKLVDGPAQDSVRVCRVYDADSHVDWLPAG
ncbi:hypothetical protein AB0323_17915 [Arthrobacter sp. NPDC080031]|uniref:hypothetical protein n=1 Tax=Arthrobacter sp. NPDC080031 TaxID=3155918 RepID=UPI00344B1E30